MEIVAVGMQDYKVMGVDRFYVKLGPDLIHTFDVFKDGKVVQVSKEPLTDMLVTSSIEKFNACFRVVPPVPVQKTSELPGFLGAFEILNDTQVRHRPAR